MARKTIALLLTAGWMLGLIPVAVARTKTIDLRRASVTKFLGADKVAAAGDVNGDQIPDALISAGDLRDGPTEGRVYVVFGQPDHQVVDLEQLGERGFLIQGAEERDFASEADGVGDLNGDGLDDIAVGALGAENNGRDTSGSVYIVFGKADSEPVMLRDWDLNIQGRRGFRIDGAASGDATGYSVAGVGDVNADGLPDLAAVGLSGRAAYVIFGQEDPPIFPLDLLTFHYGLQGDAGFRFDLSGTKTGYSVAAGGDMNGDGLDDVLVGVGDPESSSFVLFGKDSTAPLSAKDLGRRGLSIRNSGEQFSGAGDMNGDGFDDLLVGVNVMFGRRRGGEIDRWRPMDWDGLLIRVDPQQLAGRKRLAPAGDVNGDGLADILVATAFSDHNGRKDSGSVFVLYGKKGTRDFDLSRLGSDGYRIDGARAGDVLGIRVAMAGDVNQDGIPDHLISAPERSGAYLVWGRRP